MDFRVRKGTRQDLAALARLYDTMNDHLAATHNYPGWKKGIYPTREDAEGGLREGSLFVAVEEEEIIGSMILRHQPEPAYLTAPWQAALADEEVLVLHTFVVHPQKLRHGIGGKMLAFAAQYGKDTGVKALRLDVYEQNSPAIRLYERCGYRYIDTVSLGLEDRGLNWFRLYEKLL